MGKISDLFNPITKLPDKHFNLLIGLDSHKQNYDDFFKSKNNKFGEDTVLLNTDKQIGLGTDTDQLKIQSEIREKIQISLGRTIFFVSILIIGIDFFTYNAFIDIPDLALKLLIVIKLFLWSYVVWVTHRVIILPEKITDLFKTM